MAILRWIVARNVEAEDEAGNPIKIALCFIEHENGHKQRHAIREDFIAFAGESVIEMEVMEAARL